jgi:hypothetical protein
MSSDRITKIFTKGEIVEKIFIIRGQKVMLDKDPAEMYGMETSVLNQAVKRNISRFPEDFIFQLNNEEYALLISQIVISKKEGRGGTRKLPFAFNKEIWLKIEKIERALVKNDEEVKAIFNVLKKLLLQEDKPGNAVGFKIPPKRN